MHRQCGESYPIVCFTTVVNKKFSLIFEMVAKIDDTVPSNTRSHFI